MNIRKGDGCWQPRWEGKEGAKRLQQGEMLVENEDVDGNMS